MSKNMEKNPIKSIFNQILKLMDILNNKIKEQENFLESEMKQNAEKFTSEVNLIEFNKKEETSSFDKSLKPLINEKMRQIENRARSISKRVYSLTKQMIENIDNILYKVFFNKALAIASDEAFSNSEASSTEDNSFDYDEQLNCPKENIHNVDPELVKNVSNISRISSNNSDTNNFNSSSDKNCDNIKNFLKCEVHQDRDVEWQGEKEGETKLFCSICKKH